MTYIPLYALPDFQQSIPSDGVWTCQGSFNSGLKWESETGQTVTVPHIWYNSPSSTYADGLRYNAARNDECAAYKDSEDKAWSAGDAERNRRQARRLRAMAMLCDRSPNMPAGKIDFRGLNDPTRSSEQEIAAIEQIEAEALI